MVRDGQRDGLTTHKTTTVILMHARSVMVNVRAARRYGIYPRSFSIPARAEPESGM